MSIKAVIFDYDGVIADGFEANYLGWAQCFMERGLKGFDRDFFRKVYGTGARNIARPILEANDKEVSEDILLDLIHLKSVHAENYSEHIQLIPGIKDFLKLLSGLKLAIATGNSRMLVEKLNQGFGIDEFFSVIVGSEDISPNKLDLKGVLVAASKLEVLPKECLVVEDSPLGIEAAKRCGMKCLALTTSKPRESLTEADLIIDGYQEFQLESLEFGGNA